MDKVFQKKVIDPSREDFEISYLKKMPLTARGSTAGGTFKFDLNATEEEDQEHTSMNISFLASL